MDDSEYESEIEFIPRGSRGIEVRFWIDNESYVKYVAPSLRSAADLAEAYAA